MRKLPAAFLLLPIMVLLLNGCTEPLEDGLAGSNSDNSTYHSRGWKDNPQHGNDFSTNPQNCEACHGKDLEGGSSGTSCVSCHHSEETANFHHGGTVAHIVCEQCDGCHGEDLTGGLTSTSCFACHPNRDKCATCHEALQSHPVHTVDNSKGPSPLLACEVCHDENPFNYTQFADGYDLNNTAICDNCHSPGGHFDGSQMAKTNWNDGIYEKDGTSIQSGNEQWCAACHDDEPAFSRPKIIPDVILDNENPSLFSVTGTWNTFSASCVYVGTNFHYHPAGTGAYSATWQVPADLPAGTYNVYAIWCGISNREDENNYTINHRDGSDVAGPFDQRQNGGIWVLLGTYTFDAGSGSVVLSGTDSDGIVHAEAIKWEVVQGQGAYAPNVIGDNATYGYYVNGHKLSCSVCHDLSSNHIDHNPQTYEVDEATYQAVNTYEGGYRLKDVAGNRPMVIPKTTVPDINNLDPSEFALCFKCHDSDAILSASTDNTNFYDDDANPWNSHWTHLRMSGVVFWDSDWDTIIGGTNGESLDSIASCTTCHNVHGSVSSMMIRHGELISTPSTSTPVTNDKVPALDFCYLDGVESRDCTMPSAYPNSVGGSMNMRGGYPEGGNAVCKHCHSGYVYYYRTPKDIGTPLNPKVLYPRAVPSSMANDGASQVLLTALVVDPNEDLSSVEIDLTSLGGSSNQTMYDDGASGDETAGDDTYSYLVSGTTVPVGNKTLTITATDALSNTGTGEMVVVVHDDYGAIIVDNLEADFVCNWSSSTNNPGPGEFWGFDVQYRSTGSGSCTATWVPDVPTAGDYNVYARWTEYWNRGDNVPYTINYNGGSHTEWVNQQDHGGTWYPLGTYNFAAGTSGSVVLSDNATGGDLVVADAIKFEPLP